MRAFFFVPFVALPFGFRFVLKESTFIPDIFDIFKKLRVFFEGKHIWLRNAIQCFAFLSSTF